MKLCDAKPGKYRVISIEGGAHVKEKLLRQGVLPGKSIEVVTIQKHGPCVIQIGDTRMIIGSGMSTKIMVE